MDLLVLMVARNGGRRRSGHPRTAASAVAERRPEVGDGGEILRRFANSCGVGAKGAGGAWGRGFPVTAIALFLAAAIVLLTDGLWPPRLPRYSRLRPCSGRQGYLIGGRMVATVPCGPGQCFGRDRSN